MQREEYALFSSARNRIILVDSDHENLKYVQLLTMNHELMYLMDLNGIVNYRSGLLNNERCTSVTVANGEKLRIEIDMYFTNPSYRLVPARTEASPNDLEFQQKMIFLLDFVKKIRNDGDRILHRDLRQVEVLKKGLRIFKKFLAMTLPKDKEIQKFIDREIANKDIPKEILQEFQIEVFRILRELDYSLALDAIKSSISDELDRIPISAYYFNESIYEAKKVLQ